MFNRTSSQLTWLIIGFIIVGLLSCLPTTSFGIILEQTQKVCNCPESFVTWDLKPPSRPDPRRHERHKIPFGNKARIQLEALVNVFDSNNNFLERFVLIAGCRTEWVYADKDLFQKPGGKYQFVFSHGGTSAPWMRDVVNKAKSLPVHGSFRSMNVEIRTYKSLQRLQSVAQINEATEQGRVLVGQTELHDPNNGRTYVLEYPVKTMNFQPEGQSFQVDTGPVLVPVLEKLVETDIDRMAVAHIAYNHIFSSQRSEFVFRHPIETPDLLKRLLGFVRGPTYGQYSETRSYKAQSVLYAVKDK